MEGKKYLVTKDIKINDEYSIKKGNHVIIDWNGMDGAWWECVEDNSVGCPFIDLDSIKEVIG